VEEINPTRRGRPKNPRRVVLPELRQLAAWTKSMIGVWGQSMSTWERGARESRKLRDDEKPENQARRWHQLAEYMVAIIAKAEEIHEYALARKREIEGISTERKEE
jgi:hypothetical protein